MTPYVYYAAYFVLLVLVIYAAKFVAAWFFPKTEDDATDPYVDGFDGLSAPRENGNG